MKTFAQELTKWVDSKKQETTDEKELLFIDELQTKMEELMYHEKYTINAAYDKGYIDREMKRPKNSSHYETNYRITELLMSFKNNNNGNND
jgi:formate-dependent nitrite reductase cytochrome c552 subunit